MTSQEVLQLVRSQIGDRWDATNAHGVKLRQCLVSPTTALFDWLRPVRGGEAVNEAVELWIVLEELPDSKDGYKIVFEEASGEFGLAIRDQNGRLAYLGRYGDFMTTLIAM